MQELVGPRVDQFDKLILARRKCANEQGSIACHRALDLFHHQICGDQLEITALLSRHHTA